MRWRWVGGHQVLKKKNIRGYVTRRVIWKSGRISFFFLIFVGGEE